MIPFQLRDYDSLRSLLLTGSKIINLPTSLDIFYTEPQKKRRTKKILNSLYIYTMKLSIFEW